MMTDLRSPAARARRLTRMGLSLALLCLALPACTATQGRQSAGRAMPDGFFSALDTRPPAKSGPLVSLPRSGAVTNVDETTYANGRRQRISLEGPNSRSRIEIMLRTGGRGGLPMDKPTRAGIAGELAQLASEGSYRIVRRPIRNRYGQFGVALSARCAYAWQWIDNLRGQDRGLDWTGGEVAASLRVEHCQRGPTTPEALLADLERLSIRTGSGQEPAPWSPRPRRRIVRAAEPQEPAPAPVPAPAAIPPLPAPAPVAINSSRTLVTAAPQRPPQYLSGEAARPQAGAAAGEVGQSFAVPRPSGQGGASLDQPRFLSERVATAPADRRAGETAAPPPPVPVRAPQPERLSADVPAQAYRGPVPPPFGW
ncbi:hypothetical protein J2X36_002504 [Methylobacterium sp. BE186]|uniref:cellulose biosynthesis protein BcsN n=1 Tax=Methylobacterium sp. BE186 TaxID=2817715 RepID=UPI00286403FC|nr:cellulose biosynthesis protein BcsN [Methylobacterium sp. BE186]MDR7037753.1 hypothetical protein [Methylobacterium sp. BE186]